MVYSVPPSEYSMDRVASGLPAWIPVNLRKQLESSVELLCDDSYVNVSLSTFAGGLLTVIVVT